MSKQVRRVCFTVNNYSELCYEQLKAWGVDNCKYMVIGKEVGQQGTHHLQGFCILNKNKRLSAVTNALTKDGRHPYTVPANGSNEQASTYCKKDGVFFEHGAYPKGRGSRTDVKDYLEAVARGADDEILAQEHPECFARYTRAADKLRTTIKKKRKLEEMSKDYSGASLRPWQKIVIKKLGAQDDRKVTWVYDPTGNIGKSWLGNYLLSTQDTFLIEGGKRADIAYAYNYEKNVVFDFTRSQEEQVNYSTIESFKNGRIFSSKYESGLKLFAPAKVLCLSNFYPDKSKLSEDRWQILEFPAEEDTGIPPPRKKRRRCAGACNCCNF